MSFQRQATVQHTHAPNPDQAKFLARNKVSSSFKGPVFAVEDQWYQCSHCLAPVAPVERVIVGAHSYHPACLRCSVCGLPSKANIYYPARGQPVCEHCTTRGLHPPKSLSRSPIAGVGARELPRSRPATGRAAMIMQYAKETDPNVLRIEF